MPNVVPFPTGTDGGLPFVDLDEIRARVARIPINELAREANRASVKAAVARRRRVARDVTWWLYFAAFCLARLADEPPLDGADSAVVVSFVARS